MESAESTAGLRSELDEAWALLDQLGHGDGVRAIRGRLRSDAAKPPTVVVVGEANRGQRSLINALLGMDGVAPVGSDIVTGAYVEYVPANIEHQLRLEGRAPPARAPLCGGPSARPAPRAPVHVVAGGQAPDAQAFFSVVLANSL